MTDTSVAAPSRTAGSRPSTLKPVLDVIPDRCYERSTVRGLGILARDLVIYGLAVWGLVSTNNPLLLVPLWIVAGAATASLFVVGHDAAHRALFDAKWLNALVGQISMLPSLHATEVWVFGHNRVHHGFTLREGMDFVWHPSTVEDYRAMSRFQRLRHRFEWGPFGSGAYYLREVWWNKMVRFTPPDRHRRAMRRDQAIVAVFALAVLGLALATSGVGGGLWLWVKVVVIPFLLFCQTIGWVVYVHHIEPETRWWSRSEWNKFHGQVEGTTVLWGPPGWDLMFHWIMVHVPHHVDMRIPCYRLTEAAKAIIEAFPDDVTERPLSARDYVRSTRTCKLHDFTTGEWLPYSAAR
ncbi:MAG: fatty acid desaturase [Actinomycetota bacterium]